MLYVTKFKTTPSAKCFLCTTFYVREDIFFGDSVNKGTDFPTEMQDFRDKIATCK